MIDAYKAKIEDIEKRLTKETDEHRIAERKADFRELEAKAAAAKVESGTEDR